MDGRKIGWIDGKRVRWLDGWTNDSDRWSNEWIDWKKEGWMGRFVDQSIKLVQICV